MQMRRLESLLERQLFQRTGRCVVPTGEGELLLEYATRILALGDEAGARLQQTEISGGVRIRLAEEVATAALPVRWPLSVGSIESRSPARASRPCTRRSKTGWASGCFRPGPFVRVRYER
jgi:hypothetical protein